MHIMYVIQHTVTKQRYIGRTRNLEKRLKQHNQNEQTATTRKGGEWILVYAEAFRDKQSAVTRELRLKNHGRAKQELFLRIKGCFLN